mmetsp:Transcript_70102/g.169709  ORF Transcript_70102/g.169709 Transcript_70102/m.169709 type:complete len:500 (+) Transcript_70102:21-1520(+)
MKLLAFVALAGLAAVYGQAVSPLSHSYGTAAYTYGPLKCDPDPCDVTPSCNHAEFKPDIEAFNTDTSISDTPINIVYSYGGDIELWPDPHYPHSCWAPAQSPACNISVFYDPVNAEAAMVYREAQGVTSVVALLDGRLDGWQQIQTYNDYDGCKFGDFYPNLNNLTHAQRTKLAQDLGHLYCKGDTLTAVQVDLEPYKPLYEDAINDFVGQVAQVLRDEGSEYNCRNANWPNGRSVSYFTFAHSQSMKFTTDVLGANGYYVFSGYDLYPKPEDGGFMYNNVTEFGQKLRYELNFIRPVIGSVGHFTLALPFAASCHEYEQYKPMHGDGCGPACEPLTNSALMHEYVQEAFNVLLDPATTRALGGVFCQSKADASQFLGLSWWTWTHEMTYPPMKWFANDFFPVTPSQASLNILKTNLPKLADGTTTCISQDSCTDAEGRPNGCTCSHKDQCASAYCTGTCSTPPEEIFAAAPESWVKVYGDPRETKAGKAMLEEVNLGA